MTEFMKTVSSIGVIPVVKIDDASKAVPLAKALEAGGIPAAEITFRTDAAASAIQQIAKECPNVLVGAGTVLNVEQCERAIQAGAKFIVSPGYNQDVVDYCNQRQMPVLPGCANASDITRAANSGLEVVKFFPAEQAGGLGYIKALAPVFPKMMFMPTGGVNAGNLNSYLSFPRILACGGSWMVKADLIAEDRFDEITALCRQAMETMLGFELAHVGINGENNEEAGSVANAFQNLFGFQAKEGNSSWFAGSFVEIMKKPYLGRCGHIAISTLTMPRAVAYLERIGVAVDHDTAKYDAKDNLTAVYLKDEVGGFAVHLVQKK